MSETPEKPHRTGAFWLDMVVAIAAVGISMISLWVAARADNTQERLLAASVWPDLEYYTSDVNPNGKPTISFNIRNAGVGPAKVRWVTLEYEGKPIFGPRHLLEACCGKKIEYVMSTISRTVIVPRDAVGFIVAKPAVGDVAGFRALEHATHEIHFRACYCSVLDDCWLFDNASEEDPKPVSNCSQVPANAYEG